MSYNNYFTQAFFDPDPLQEDLIRVCARVIMESNEHPENVFDLPIFKDDEKNGATLHADSQPIGFVHDYLNSGAATLVGQPVSNALHLGQLAQVYQHPKFEVFHAVYTKGNEVVGHTALTNRMIGADNPYAKHGDSETTIKHMKEHMQNLGADGYYIIHNHPQGISYPSQPDINLTLDMSKKLPGMRAHVVINHKKYGVIKTDGSWTEHEVDQSDSYDLMKHRVPHDVIGTKIDGPATVMKIGKQFHKDGNVTLIGLKDKQTHFQVKSVATFPAHMLSARGEGNLQRGISRVNNFIQQTGADSKAIIAVPKKEHIPEFEHLVVNGLVHSVVSFDGSRSEATPSFEPADQKFYSVFESKKRLSDPLDTEEGQQILTKLKGNLT